MRTRRRHPRSKPPLDPAALHRYALRALARRSHSVAELRRKLSDRSPDSETVVQTLERLQRAGWLDDHRFALEFTRSRAHRRRYGRRRIERELQARGVADRFIAQALGQVFPTEDTELDLLRQRIDRRLARIKPPLSQKHLRSLYAALLRAGFPSAIIRKELFDRPEVRRAAHSPGRKSPRTR